MHNIEVDDEVFGRLQRLAQPFVDTPNSVLRRTLGLDEGHSPEDGDRLSTGQGDPLPGTKEGEMTNTTTAGPAPLMTPQRDFRPAIVELLMEAGGGRRMQEVLAGIEDRMGPRFHPHDWHPLPTGEIRWRNAARWERMKMAEEGLIKKGTAAGWWELTEDGHSA